MPDKIVVPDPDCDSLPVPLMALLMATASERLMIKLPLLVIVPVPKLPDVPPLPTSKVPPLTMVVTPL